MYKRQSELDPKNDSNHYQRKHFCKILTFLLRTTLTAFMMGNCLLVLLTLKLLLVFLIYSTCFMIEQSYSS